MEYFLQIFSGALAGVIVSFLLKTWITSKVTDAIKHEYDAKLEELKGIIQTQLAQQNHKRWLLKRKACLRALELANAALSNYTYSTGDSNDILPQHITIEEARACIDELACSCDAPYVLDSLKEILFESVTTDRIVDLRNAIRIELEFRSQEIDSDRDKAFIGNLNCIKS